MARRAEVEGTEGVHEGERERPPRQSAGGSVIHRTPEGKWTSARGRRQKYGGDGVRTVRSAGGTRRRLASSLVDPAVSSARRDVTMAAVVIAVRCVTVIS